MAEFIAAKRVFLFTFRACAFGAPWKKPTTILKTMLALSSIQRYCFCKCPHQVLAGKSPDGRNWTAVASPYWPELTHVGARLCGPPPTVSEEVPTASRVAGFGFGNEDCSLDGLLS